MMGHPTVYPTGATLYNPQKAYNGFTIIPVKGLGGLLIDMNGAEVHLWRDVHGFPHKILPGGFLMGSRGLRNPRYGLQDQTDLIQCDYQGNIVWKFTDAEFVEDPGEKPSYMARQHHDYQREGSSVGYYSPCAEPLVAHGKTLVLSHRDILNPKISDKPLLDDVIYEVDWHGNITWEWLCSDHFDEFEFDDDAKQALRNNPNSRGESSTEQSPNIGDWMHINSMSTLGPNKWYDSGDSRFHPDNIIADGRETNIIFIIDRKSGKIVWKVGPDYREEKPESRLGWIIGQHHAHMIPRGLLGEGNILVFDNGGWAGYGAPNPAAPQGVKNATRDWSRVLEFDPVALRIVWQYTPREAGCVIPLDAHRFYSPFVSSAQRLPNGNTLITEGSDGRLLEVTADHELVWEYINPYRDDKGMNMVYRAYRMPYAWVPQAEPGPEKPIRRPQMQNFRLPNAADSGILSEARIKGTEGYPEDAGDCVGSV